MSPRFHPFLRLTIFVVGALVVQRVVGTVIYLALGFASRVSHRSPAQSQDFLNHNQLLLALLVYPPTLLWLWFCRRAFDRQTFASLGLRTRGAVSSLGWGALCGALTIGFLFAVLAVCGFVRINGLSAQWQQAGPRGLGLLAFYAFAFCCVGLTEEIMFRGYALHNLTSWLGVRAAVWVQAILFGLIHLGNVLVKTDAHGTMVSVPPAQWGSAFWDARWGIVNIVLIGVFFALAFLKTGSLWFPIGFHAAWDFFLGCIFSLPVSGIPVFRVLDVSAGTNTLATGGSFGAEGSVFLVALIAAMIWLMRREPDHAQALSDLAALRPDILTAPRSENTVQEPMPETIEEDDDPTHIPRFRTSMRPASPRASLQLSNADSSASSTRPGFAPIAVATSASTSAPVAVAPTDSTAASALETAPNAITSDATAYVPKPFSPLFPTATIEESAASSASRADEAVLPVMPTQVIAEPVTAVQVQPLVQATEVQAAEVQAAEVQETASSPLVERPVEKRQPTVIVEQSGSAPQPATPPKPKKAVPKW